MNRAGRLTVVVACTLLLNCSRSSETLPPDGLTADQQALLIKRSIDQIETTETFTSDNFEQLQRSHFETMNEEMREAAQRFLQKRSDKVALLGMSQTVELDHESAEIESHIVDPKKAMALVVVNGSRTYQTSNASKTSKTRFALPWIITIDGGELVFRHSGIRMRDIAD